MIFNLFFLSFLNFFYVNEPVIDMRMSPTHDSKVVSQALFAENVKIENKVDDWVQIVTSDNYTGWIEAKNLITLNHLYETSITVSRLKAHVFGIKDTEYGPIKSLPYGTKLQIIDSSDARWIKIALPDEQICYIQKGDVAEDKELTTKKDLIFFSQKFLGLPYTWGGRSSFGFDCSGFVQMLYGKIGIELQRDSKQQVVDERFKTVSLKELEPGDLIFFGQSEDKISHVGMYIGDDMFIHSTVRECQPWIRVSVLSDSEWSGGGYPYRIFRQLLRNKKL